jgi:NADH-quinone oxidoreductase subunit C
MPDEESQSDAESSAEGEETPAKPEQPAPEESKAEQPKAEQPAEEEDEARPRPSAGGIADLLADVVAETLPDIKLEAYQGMTDVVVEVDREDIPKVMPLAKDDPRLDLNFLRCLSGVDHEAEGLEVVYHLLSLEKGHEVVIKTRLPSDDAHVASVASVWKAANWHEREARDMFGITFDDHPHLVPLLLPEDMTDHFPLRKDNPLAEIEEWQGDQLPEEGVGGSKTR